MTDAIEVVRHPRARRLKLRVDPVTGVARLTLPPRAALAPALRWARAQQPWIDRQRSGLAGPVPFTPDGEIPFRGHPVTIRWDAGRKRAPQLIEGELWCGGPAEGLERRIERWLRARALAALGEDSTEFAMRAGVTVKAVRLNDARRRWGSCTTDGTIRYSWRLILAPDWVRRATAAHEVAHRLHMDHSPAFHAAVRRLLGEDPRPARDWLRHHGAGLHQVGNAAPDLEQD